MNKVLFSAFACFGTLFAVSCRNQPIGSSDNIDMDNKAAEYQPRTSTGGNKLEMYSPEAKKMEVGVGTATNTKVGLKVSDEESSNYGYDKEKKSTKKGTKKPKVQVDTRMADMFDKLAIDLRQMIADDQIDFSRTPEGMAMIFNPGVTFKYTSEILTDEAKVRLDGIVDVLEKYPYADIMVEGHADSTGNVPRNKYLSETRAKNVALYMKTKGVKADRIAIAGYGATKPIATNKTEEGRAMNRRVLIRIKADEKKIK